MPYKFNFTLDDIYELIPMSVKEVKKYYPMINYFRKLGVEIKIESERRGRFSRIV
jgi:ATP-dependent RNA circularization protein (DNA/RNA ligase family)